MVNLKITVFGILAIILILNPVALAANNATVFILPLTTSEKTETFFSTIFTQIKVADNSNRITGIDISVHEPINEGLIYNTVQGNGDTGVLVTLSDNFTYIMAENSFSYLGFIPYHTITQSMFYKNYTIFSNNFTTDNIIPTDLHAKINYDINTKNTTFVSYTGFGFIKNEYATKNYVGMYADNILVNGMSKNDVAVTYVNPGNIMTLEEEINSLSPFTRMVYDVIDYVTLWVDITPVRSVLRMIDLFIGFVMFIFQVIFVYPHLIAAWILIIIPNFYTAYRSNTIKELEINYVRYYKAVVIAAFAIGKYVSQTVIWIINALKL